MAGSRITEEPEVTRIRTPLTGPSKGCARGNCTFVRAAMHSRSQLGVKTGSVAQRSHVCFRQLRT